MKQSTFLGNLNCLKLLHKIKNYEEFKALVYVKSYSIVFEPLKFVLPFLPDFVS